MVSGTIYGVVLNDRSEHGLLADAFLEAPYKAAPSAPVVYIKPRTCLTTGGASIPLPDDVSSAVIAATLALSFTRDATWVSAVQAMDFVGEARIAIDVSEPSDSYYRPAIRQRCRDGFLPLGGAGAVSVETLTADIVTCIDGVEAHRWTLDRLARSVPQLIADLSAFMTLRAGDMLLVGLAGDAPVARVGQSISVSMNGLPTLETRIERESDQ